MGEILLGTGRWRYCTVQQCSIAAAVLVGKVLLLLPLLLVATKIGLPRAEICQDAQGSTAMQHSAALNDNHECE